MINRLGHHSFRFRRNIQNDPNAITYLSGKIMKGSSGVWGDANMPAHSNIAQDDLHQIIAWVLSLSNKQAIKKSLAQSGSIIPPATATTGAGNVSQKPPVTMIISASYTDKGSNNTKALTGPQCS